MPAIVNIAVYNIIFGKRIFGVVAFAALNQNALACAVIHIAVYDSVVYAAYKQSESRRSSYNAAAQRNIFAVVVNRHQIGFAVFYI